MFWSAFAVNIWHRHSHREIKGIVSTENKWSRLHQSIFWWNWFNAPHIDEWTGKKLSILSMVFMSSGIRIGECESMKIDMFTLCGEWSIYTWRLDSVTVFIFSLLFRWRYFVVIDAVTNDAKNNNVFGSRWIVSYRWQFHINRFRSYLPSTMSDAFRTSALELLTCRVHTWILTSLSMCRSKNKLK